MKNLARIILPAVLVMAASCSANEEKADKVVVAYVTSWSDVMPEPSLMTHINYAFGHVSNGFDSVRVDNGQRLHEIVGHVRKSGTATKVELSIGGWGSGRFSEMADNDSLRASFAADCARKVEEFGLDGIDIDWEYPGSSLAGISSSERDTDNFTLLMRDIRAAIGPDKLLTLASSADADHIDFKAIMPYVDFVNVMTYDMANAPKHHAALYPSENTTGLTCDTSIKAHMEAGVPAEKLVLGMPFYGRGGEKMHGRDFRDIIIPEGHAEKYDSTAMVPYLVDTDGELVLGFDNACSIATKCDYIIEKGLLGAMYWDYAGDDDARTLSRTISSAMMK